MIKRINKSPQSCHYVRMITTSSDIKPSYKSMYNSANASSKIAIAMRLKKSNYNLYLDVCK